MAARKNRAGKIPARKTLKVNPLVHLCPPLSYYVQNVKWWWEVEPPTSVRKTRGGEPILQPEKRDYATKYADAAGHAGEDISKVVLAWAKLPEAIRAAILALVDAAEGGPR